MLNFSTFVSFQYCHNCMHRVSHSRVDELGSSCRVSAPQVQLQKIAISYPSNSMNYQNINTVLF